MNKKSYVKWNIVLFVGLICFSFCAVLIYNFLTPLMSDDLLFKRELYGSLRAILYEEYLHYNYWTGRSVLQILLKICKLMPKVLFNILNSAMFVLLSLLVYCNVPNRKKYDSFLYVAIQLFLWFFSVEFGQTILWLSGACNYLWGIVIILGFITLFRIGLKKKQENCNKLNKMIWIIGLFFIGVLAGWGNENTSGGAILFLVIIISIEIFEKRKVMIWNWSGLLGACIGFGFMLLAPGNRVRSTLMQTESNYSGLAEIGSRFFKISAVLQHYFLVYFIIIVFLIVYGLYRGRKILEYREPLIWTFVAIATSLVLILAPEPMPRAYFGAGIFLTIAVFQLLWQLDVDKENVFFCIRQAAIVCGCIWFIFSYLENGLNLARILREVKERDAYVAELSQKEGVLELPKLRPQFQTKYSYMYDNDISEDKGWWINTIYATYYKVDAVIGVEREDWSEY